MCHSHFNYKSKKSIDTKRQKSKNYKKNNFLMIIPLLVFMFVTSNATLLQRYLSVKPVTVLLSVIKINNVFFFHEKKQSVPACPI